MAASRLVRVRIRARVRARVSVRVRWRRRAVRVRCRVTPVRASPPSPRSVGRPSSPSVAATWAGSPVRAVSRRATACPHQAAPPEAPLPPNRRPRPRRCTRARQCPRGGARPDAGACLARVRVRVRVRVRARARAPARVRSMRTGRTLSREEAAPDEALPVRLGGPSRRRRLHVRDQRRRAELVPDGGGSGSTCLGECGALASEADEPG
jgi:hypothetical protein